MPKVINQGIGVYYETEGSGPPLVMQHGLTESLEYWRDFGYTEALRKNYRLILIDARGHGKSDAPSDESVYHTERMASDVVVVLDALGIEHTHYLGYSMGGWIGYHLGIESPHRVLSMILGGAHPFADDLSAFLSEFQKQGTPWMLGFWDAIGAPLSDGTRRQLIQQPLFPLFAIFRKNRLDLSKSLHKMRMPVLIYAGDQDMRYREIKDCVSLLSNAKWVSFPGLDHCAAQMRSDLALPHIEAFLSHVDPTKT
jgi:pimeloyl-ACP methyl ester carboxylesterase